MHVELEKHSAPGIPRKLNRLDIDGSARMYTADLVFAAFQGGEAVTNADCSLGELLLANLSQVVKLTITPNFYLTTEA